MTNSEARMKMVCARHAAFLGLLTAVLVINFLLLPYFMRMRTVEYRQIAL